LGEGVSFWGVDEGAPLRVGEGFNLGVGAGVAQRMARALVWVWVKVFL